MDRKKLAKRIAYLILFILVANIFANKFYWYFSTWYTDIIMHFLGGLWIGLFYLYIFPPKSYTLRLMLRVLSAVFVVGLGWEVFEIIVNEVVARNPFDVSDTLSDILFDLLGGMIASLYFRKRIMINQEDAIR